MRGQAQTMRAMITTIFIPGLAPRLKVTVHFLLHTVEFGDIQVDGPIPIVTDRGCHPWPPGQISILLHSTHSTQIWPIAGGGFLQLHWKKKNLPNHSINQSIVKAYRIGNRKKASKQKKGTGWHRKEGLEFRKADSQLFLMHWINKHMKPLEKGRAW